MPPLRPPRPLSPALPIPVTPVRLPLTKTVDESLRDVPPVSPIQGAKLELCPDPRVPVRGPGCPWSHSPCAQPRSPAAAFQACKTYWKSCGCKSWPPLRARNLSCNPERAAGSKHSTEASPSPFPASGILFQVSSERGDTSGSAGPPEAGQVWGKAGKSWDAFPKPPPLLTDGLVPC